MNESSTLVWRCVATQPDSCANPDELHAEEREWLPLSVPGTAAGAMAADLSGRALAEFDFDAYDWWFVGTPADADGRRRSGSIEFDGVATLSDVWIGSRHMAHNESMFAPFRVDFHELDSVTIKCASLKSALAKRRPRGRWRSSMVSQQTLRWFRTTVFGRADLFSGAPAPVGPWRAVRVVDTPQPRLSTWMDGDTGVLALEVHAGQLDTAETVHVDVGDRSFEVRTDASGWLDTQIRLTDVERWWPHTHGAPRLHRVAVRSGSVVTECGSVGFRTIGISRADDGFALSMNGTRVFCRGACWVPIDPITLNAAPELMRSTLRQVTCAGFNMVRLTGTMMYEDAQFWNVCAELGIMVWQDIMLATFDPPADVEFANILDVEVRTLPERIAANPALTVVSGGGETEQQPAMLGLTKSEYAMPTLDSHIPQIVSEIVPHIPYVTSTPSGPIGVAPFEVSSGVAHYFGVGGYLEPVDSVRAAGVRFAAECLAFAIPPERASVEAAFGSASVAGHDPDWKSAVPRDRGSSWDFEDVRDHYVREVFGVDPFAIRRVDPEKYLDFGRAAVCVAVSETFKFWRQHDSRCDGALVLTYRDFEDGAGWGLVDSRGVPKAAWHVLRRVCAPCTVTIVDAGLDGLRFDVYNDGPEALDATLLLHTHDTHGRISDTVEVELQVGPHSSRVLSSSAVWKSFSDVSYAYRFGPAAAVGVSAELRRRDGTPLAHDAFPSERGPLQMQRHLGLEAVARLVDESWTVELTTRTPAFFVAVEASGFEPSDSWFHLLPGTTRVVRLEPSTDIDVSNARIRGHVRALNCSSESPILKANDRETDQRRP